MEPQIKLYPLDRPKHNKKETIVLIVILIFLLLGVGFGLFTILKPESTSFQERAQTKTSLSCPANGATCSWSAVTGATSYSFVIFDQTDNQLAKEGTTQETRISFTPLVGHTYICTVKAVNQCGMGPESKAVNSCVGVGILTPTTQNTPTPSPTQGITPTGKQVQALLPTQTPTPTAAIPTPTKVITPTTTITPPLVEIIISTQPTPTLAATPQITPSGTPIPTGVPTLPVMPTVTPIPTGGVAIAQLIPTGTPILTLFPTSKPKSNPPSAGSNVSVLFMIVSTVILVSLVLVF